VVNFADLSHHQAGVDLAAYRAAGHDRVVLKATEGPSFVDPAFVARWREAGRLRLVRVAYHFARAANSGTAECDHFMRTVRAAGLEQDDWLCLDVEDTETPGRAAAHAREFTTHAVQLGRPDGLVYTGRWYADPNKVTAATFPPGWRRLWLSDYGRKADADITLPAGWSRAQLAARQYTDGAEVAGVRSRCDHSRVLNDWLQPAGKPTTDPPTQQEDEVHPIFVYATGSPLYLYWPATGRLVGVGDAVERDTLEKVHTAAGTPIQQLRLGKDQLAQLIEFTHRAPA
jgi:lysozyme